MPAYYGGTAQHTDPKFLIERLMRNGYSRMQAAAIVGNLTARKRLCLQCDEQGGGRLRADAVARPEVRGSCRSSPPRRARPGPIRARRPTSSRTRCRPPSARTPARSCRRAPSTRPPPRSNRSSATATSRCSIGRCSPGKPSAPLFPRRGLRLRRLPPSPRRRSRPFHVKPMRRPMRISPSGAAARRPGGDRRRHWNGHPRASGRTAAAEAGSARRCALWCGAANCPDRTNFGARRGRSGEPRRPRRTNYGRAGSGRCT